mgnify:CR=1 FL=1
MIFESDPRGFGAARILAMSVVFSRGVLFSFHNIILINTANYIIYNVVPSTGYSYCKVKAGKLAELG